MSDAVVVEDVVPEEVYLRILALQEANKFSSGETSEMIVGRAQAFYAFLSTK